MADSTSHPTLIAPVLDAVDAQALAGFYAELLGYHYGQPNDEDWVVLTNSAGRATLAIQRVDSLPTATWPDEGVPQQVHLDMACKSSDELQRHHQTVLKLGGTLLRDGSQDSAEAIMTFADPEGHPFCILVSQKDFG